MSHWSRIGSALVVAIMACPASAQFDQFTWTFDGGGSGIVDATHMNLVSSDGWGGCIGGDWTSFLTTATESGTIDVHFSWDNQDSGFGWWLAEKPYYVVDDTITYVGTGMPGFDFADFEKDVSFTVEAGQEFGFGVLSVDCEWGPGVLDLTGFSFVPATWSILGGALAGSAGVVPSLVGLGALIGGTPYILSLVDAKPIAPAWLVLGLAPLQAPFKGGVLVPQPDLLLAFTTSPQGRIILTGSWPNGMPSGATLYFQYWITDAAGPMGWAASNGVAAHLP